MNAFGNKKLSMVAFFMAFVLVSVAFLGLAIIPGAMALQGDFDDPYPDDTLLEGAGIGADWAYSTSMSQVIPINYTLRDKASTLYPEQVLVYTMVDTTEVNLYKWVKTDGDLADPFNWTMNLTTGDYIITVEVIFYEQIDGDYRMDSMDLGFSVVDGTGLFNDITADPTTVTNSGMDEIQFTLDINREMENIDHDLSTVAFWNEDTQMWSEVDFPEPEQDNVTIVGHNTVATVNATIPMDFPVGEYYVFFNLVDLWGYEETFNASAFTVIMKEMAPEMTDGMVSFDEDMYAAVDLEDHFSDINGQTLTYWFNETLLDNLMVVWEGGMLNFTAAMDWNGEEMFTIWVSDGVNNVSFDMTITVNAMDDDLMVAMDTTILVDEDVMMATFNPLDLFYDPDGPVENLAVSINYTEDNSTGNITMVPGFSYMDENITVMINETDPANSKAMVNVDVEMGRWMFPIQAWIDGNVTGDPEMAYVEIVPMNDVPMLSMDMVTVYKNELQTINLSEYFTDADGPMLNLTVDTNVSGALLTYDWETFMLTINPARNWTGMIDVEINATDGEDYDVYTLTIEVMLRSYTVTGTIDFADVEVDNSTVTLTIGGMDVAVNEDGTFSYTMDEGEYMVELVVPSMYLYDEAAEQDGLVIPMLDNLTLDGDVTYDITLTYMEYMSPVPAATWANINFTTKEVKDVDGTIEITIGVTNDTYTGYDEMTIQFVIEDDEDEYVFNMTWDAEMKKFVLELTEDDLEDVPEGDRKYTFTDGTEESAEFEYEFKEKDENANLITVIVLIVLIILVLIALVFIMRKPSEEEFDEEDEDEEEEGERSCPSCGETVTDEETDECPYCGENLEE